MTLQVILIASLAANVFLAVMAYSYLAAIRAHKPDSRRQRCPQRPVGREAR